MTTGTNPAAAANAAAATKVATSETYKNHYVQEGKLQKTWGEYFSGTSIDSLQNEYDATKVAEKAEHFVKTVAYAPFRAVAFVCNQVMSFLSSIYNAICGSSKTAEETVTATVSTKTEKTEK